MWPRCRGSVRVAETGEVRLELPGRFSIESFFPDWKSGDQMNITFIPTTTPPPEDDLGE